MIIILIILKLTLHYPLDYYHFSPTCRDQINEFTESSQYYLPFLFYNTNIVAFYLSQHSTVSTFSSSTDLLNIQSSLPSSL